MRGYFTNIDGYIDKNQSNKILKQLVGKEFKDEAFVSTSISSGLRFNIVGDKMSDYRTDAWENMRMKVSENGLKNRPNFIEPEYTLKYNDDISNYEFVKISTLTREEFLKLQRDEFIPPEYNVEDWIK